MVTARSRPKPLLQIVPVDRLEATTGGEGLTARLKALALAALGSLARQAGCASSSPRKRGAARPGFNSAHPPIHTQKHAQRRSRHLAGGGGWSARRAARRIA